MTGGHAAPGPGAQAMAPRWLIVAAWSAVVVGIWLRASGLQSLSFADDEYYIVRSVENILRSGLPEYPCGGFYPRGLVFQYLSALLHLAGIPVDVAPRVVAVCASLAALPAAFILARRVGGTTLGWLVVAWLALSSWQIDVARFGRMYAPFQAVFLWYLVFFLRYTVDRDRLALGGMLALTVLGVLVWEGGALLALANLTVPLLQGRLLRPNLRAWLYLAGCSLLFVTAYVFANHDFRQLVPELVYPTGFDRDSVAAPGWQEVPSMVGPLEMGAVPWLAAAAALLAGTALAAFRTWVTLRENWVAAAGMVLALLAGIAHQFAAAATIVALLAVAGQIRWVDLEPRRLWPFHLALVVWAAFWIAYGALAADWYEGGDTSIVSRHAALTIAYNLAALPDYLMEVVLPWSNGAPRLGSLLAILLACAIVQSGRRGAAAEPATTTAGYLLFLFLLLLAAAASSDPPRHETRYVFFLYPLAVILAGLVWVRWLRRRVVDPQRAAMLGIAGFAAAFVLTDDSGLRSAFRPDEPRWLPAFMFPASGEAHSVPRTPGLQAAEWLHSHVRPGDRTINGVPGVDFYFRRFELAYIDWGHQRFRAYACERGTRERWGNLPLVYTQDALLAAAKAAPRSLLVLSREKAETVLAYGSSDSHVRIVWRSFDDDVQILELIARRPDSPPPLTPNR